MINKCMKTTFCTLCSTEIKNCNFAKHSKSCDGHGPFWKRPRLGSSIGLVCIFCAKESKNANGHRNHERCCPKNPNRNYVNAEGKKGSYMDFARVFRREGQECPRCGTEIIKLRVAGRGTHICPKCQKLK